MSRPVIFLPSVFEAMQAAIQDIPIRATNINAQAMVSILIGPDGVDLRVVNLDALPAVRAMVQATEMLLGKVQEQAAKNAEPAAAPVIVPP